MAISRERFWLWILGANKGFCEDRCAQIEKSIQELERRFEARMGKLEKIERIAANVARERAQRPRNWTQFRAAAEAEEGPNARR